MASGGINSHIYPSLEAAFIAIKELIARRGTPASPKELEAMAKAVREQIMSDKGWASLTLDMGEMAAYEAVFQSKLIGAANVPTASAVQKYIDRSIMSLTSGQRVDAGTWAMHVQSNLDGRAQTINSLVIDSYSKGETGPQLTRKIKAAFEGTLTREAESLARTGYMHYSQRATDAMIAENADFLKNYYYIVVFDNRTSDICKFITRFNAPNNRFKAGDPKAPAPPLHYRCRTRRIGVPEGYRPEGERVNVGGQGGKEAAKAFASRDKASDKKIRYRGRKDSNIFKAGTTTEHNYESWLRTQPEWFIKDSLGAKRADLFNKGVPLSSFSDMTGRPLKLSEIIARDKK